MIWKIRTINRECGTPTKLALALATLLVAPGLCAQELAAIYPSADPYLGEVIQENELDAAQRLINTLEEKIRTTYEAGGARRDAHPKAHGCVAATLTVSSDLPFELRHGVFQPGASYNARVRFSNGSPNATGDDITGDTRGMALKLFNIPGEKLFADPGHETEQDFILISSPFFFINEAEGYASFFEAVDSGSTWQMLKIPFILGVSGSYNAYKMLSQTIAHPVETRYWSVAPYQLGVGDARQAVKYSARPCTAGSSVIPEDPSSNYLREAMVRTLQAGPACMDFMIQPRAPEMNVEDAITEWDEAAAPFFPVARLSIHQQAFDTPAQNTSCENESYNPWHTLPDHKPLGTISRIRRVVYEAISRLRHEMNGVPQRAPQSAPQP